MIPEIPPASINFPHGPPCLSGTRAMMALQFFKCSRIKSIFVYAICSIMAIQIHIAISTAPDK